MIPVKVREKVVEQKQAIHGNGQTTDRRYTMFTHIRLLGLTDF
jgi:ribosomal protein S10